MRCGIKPLNKGRCTKTAKFLHFQDGPFCAEHYYGAVIKQPKHLSDEQAKRNRLLEKRNTVIPGDTIYPRTGFKNLDLITWNRLKRGEFNDA